MSLPSTTLRRGLTATAIVIAVLVCDQLIKIGVKTTMFLGESISVAPNWFFLHFTENKGMAFGWDFVGTTLLASLRILAVVLLSAYLFKVVKSRKPTGFLVCLSLILAGAAGNIFDNAFYGLIFSESTPYNVAHFVPLSEGYAGFLSGKVVDMFYFPLIETSLPQWLPLWGGNHFVFFSPIFNFSDAAISCGGVALLLFYRRFLSTEKKLEA